MYADAAPAVTLQLASSNDVPSPDLFEQAARAVLQATGCDGELTIRVVDDAEARGLNQRYRGIDKPTNVLSFPATGLEHVTPRFLGDIVICAPLVAAEARAQNKPGEAHWSHLVVHGVLHLLGHDHANDDEAVAMEALECRVLSSLGIADPYQGPDEN